MGVRWLVAGGWWLVAGGSRESFGKETEHERRFRGRYDVIESGKMWFHDCVIVITNDNNIIEKEIALPTNLYIFYFNLFHFLQ